MSRRLALLLACVALSGCGSFRLVRDGKVQPDVAARVKTRLVETRGLSFRRPVPMTAVGAEAARAVLEREVRRQFGPDELATLARVYASLGLLAPGTDLERAVLDLYGQQLAGFYDPAGQRMLLVTDSFRPGFFTRLLEATLRRDLTGELVLAHELTHALQDQHFGLSVGRADLGEDDAALARRAVYEGDATLAGFAAVAGKLTPRRAVSLAGKLQSVPGQLARAYPEIPPLIRETAVFPYVAGTNFVSWAYKQAGWEGVNVLLFRPPRSTEQVLHPEKYFVRPEYPLVIHLGALAPYLKGGWELAEETTLGEFLIQLLGQRFLDAGRARAFAEGWDGDRMAGLVRGEELATVWLTTWDSDGDAAEFFATYAEILAAKHPGTNPSRHDEAVVALEGPEPYYLERQGPRVLALEGPLETDLAAAAERVWRRSSFEATVPWLPLELAANGHLAASHALP